MHVTGSRKLVQAMHHRAREVDIGLIPELDEEDAERSTLTGQQVALKAALINERIAMLELQCKEIAARYNLREI